MIVFSKAYYYEMCAKNYKSKFTFIKVIQEKSAGLISGHGVEL